MNRIGYQQRADGRAAQDNQLGRLNEHGHVALFHQKAANDRSENHKNSYDGEHAGPPGAGVIWFPPA